MNLSEFDEDDNGTSSSVYLYMKSDFESIFVFEWVFVYVCLALGIPGNIMSAIVWLRLHKKNSSGVYLAALAINDLVFLLSQFTNHVIVDLIGYRFSPIGLETTYIVCVNYLLGYAVTIEPLLVLGFSVERLLAICRPLQVRRLLYVD